MKSKTTELKAEYNTNVDCPIDSKSDLFKVQAWRDQQIMPATSRFGFMHCFCKAQFLKTKSAKAMNIKFVNETKTTDPNKPKYDDI